jgi:hypothetical protein
MQSASLSFYIVSSSHAAFYAFAPMDLLLFLLPPWTFTLLQIKTTASRPLDCSLLVDPLLGMKYASTTGQFTVCNEHLICMITLKYTAAWRLESVPFISEYLESHVLSLPAQIMYKVCQISLSANKRLPLSDTVEYRELTLAPSCIDGMCLAGFT